MFKINKKNINIKRKIGEECFLEDGPYIYSDVSFISNLLLCDRK